MADRVGKRDRSIAGALEAWFEACARPLPWREARARGARDPYRSLVSEFMLQQTQVSRVVERFDRFVARFPDVESLARAPIEDVLAEWSGLGYYRRARLAHACARAIVERHEGRVPRDLGSLRALPGVGAYTAGAIASMVFGERVEAVDGNVARVMARLEGEEGETGSRALMAAAGGRARALARAAADPGRVNEAIMELGATVCTPRNARCASCPIARWCEARRTGRAGSIPRPRARGARRVLRCESVVVRWRGRVLVERRATGGLWGGLWQVPTLEAEGPRAASARAIGDWLGHDRLVRVGEFDRVLSHREVRFRVWEATDVTREAATRIRNAGRARRWAVSFEGLGVSSAHRRVLDLAGVARGAARC